MGRRAWYAGPTSSFRPGRVRVLVCPETRLELAGNAGAGCCSDGLLCCSELSMFDISKGSNK